MQMAQNMILNTFKWGIQFQDTLNFLLFKHKIPSQGKRMQENDTLSTQLEQEEPD